MSVTPERIVELRAIAEEFLRDERTPRYNKRVVNMLDALTAAQAENTRLRKALAAETEATEEMIDAALAAYEAREWHPRAAVPFAEEENREDMRAAINAAIRSRKVAP